MAWRPVLRPNLSSEVALAHAAEAWLHHYEGCASCGIGDWYQPWHQLCATGARKWRAWDRLATVSAPRSP